MKEEYIHDLALIAVKANVQSNFPAYSSENGQQKLVEDIAKYYFDAVNRLKQISSEN